MTEYQSKKVVRAYLQSHGFDVEDIETKSAPEGKKNPDLIIKEASKISFIVEVKTPDLRLHDAAHMYLWTTTHSKIRKLIHKAIKQFKDYDPKHTLPWVIVITSDNFQLNWTNLVHNIQGVVAYNGQVIKDMRNMRFIKDTDDDVKQADMIMWIQTNPDTQIPYQMKFVVNHDSKFLNEMNEVSSKLKPLEGENISP